MSAPERVFAVVVNWNGGDANAECVASLLAQGLPPERVVFVDNGSTDGSREAVAAAFPELARVDNGANLGFGEAANEGARRALAEGADAVFFVNNDVVLPEGQLAPLVAELAGRPRVGVVGPRVLDSADPARVWCAGGMLTWRENLSTLLGHGGPDGPEHRRTKDVDYVPGCALLARRELLEEVGLFDPGYFAYTEDVDLCLRARRAGWGVRMVGEARALHASSSSTGGGYNPRRKYMMGLNSIWFLRAHARWHHWLRFLVFDVATLPLLFLAGLFTGRAKSVLAKAVGIWHGLRRRRVTAESVAAGSWLW